MTIPYTPPGQGVHAAAAGREYVPAVHMTAVGETEPRGQAYPAVQGPVQFAVTAPVEDPYCPAAHGPLHVALGRPVVEPNTPLGHTTHVSSPYEGLYRPTGHRVHGRLPPVPLEPGVHQALRYHATRLPKGSAETPSTRPSPFTSASTIDRTPSVDAAAAIV